MKDLYIIECRDSAGQLMFEVERPESVFGMAAITGISSDAMAKRIYARNNDCTLTGDNIQNWPKLLNPHWVARRKTW